MGIHHDVHGRVRALKIGHQHFHFAARNPLANRLDGQREQFGAAVLAIVAIHAGHHRVLQSQHRHRLRHAPRLVVIHRHRRTLLHRAKSAAPRANIAQDHERRRAMVPAFAHVGTRRALAHRVQIQLPHQLLQLVIVVAGRRGRAQPGRPLRLGIDGNQHYLYSNCALQRQPILQHQAGSRSSRTANNAPPRLPAPSSASVR